MMKNILFKIYNILGSYLKTEKKPLTEKHNLEWFKNNIGNTLYRTKGKCKCITCKKVEDNGIVVIEEQHAEYLFNIQNELGLRYSNEKILQKD